MHQNHGHKKTRELLQKIEERSGLKLAIFKARKT